MFSGIGYRRDKGRVQDLLSYLFSLLFPVVIVKTKTILIYGWKGRYNLQTDGTSEVRPFGYISLVCAYLSLRRPRGKSVHSLTLTSTKVRTCDKLT